MYLPVIINVIHDYLYVTGYCISKLPTYSPSHILYSWSLPVWLRENPGAHFSTDHDPVAPTQRITTHKYF